MWLFCPIRCDLSTVNSLPHHEQMSLGVICFPHLLHQSPLLRTNLQNHLAPSLLPNKWQFLNTQQNIFRGSNKESNPYNLAEGIMAAMFFKALIWKGNATTMRKRKDFYERQKICLLSDDLHKQSSLLTLTLTL